MLCLKCNKDNSADASFCEECGAKLELVCTACEASVSPGARFCKKCGTAIGSTKGDASTTVSSTKSQIRVAVEGGVSEAIEGERKTITVCLLISKARWDRSKTGSRSGVRDRRSGAGDHV